MTTSLLPAEHRFPKGTVIFRQGDPGEDMFVISEGRVRLTIGGPGQEKEIGIFERGDFFGELSLLSGANRSATAEAVEDTTLLTIGRDVFAMMAKDDIEIVFWMLNIQGQRLRRTNVPLEELMKRLTRVRVAARCLRQALTPAAVHLPTLAGELGLAAPLVEETVAELVQQGAGILAGGEWRADGPEHIAQLAAALCRFTDA
jgi:CRP-like cAMP-binding protein